MKQYACFQKFNAAKINLLYLIKDTFIEYEPCIYRNYLFDDLKELSEKFSDIKDVFNALDEIEPLDDSLVASDAFIREFIGNSSLSY